MKYFGILIMDFEVDELHVKNNGGVCNMKQYKILTQKDKWFSGKSTPKD